MIDDDVITRLVELHDHIDVPATSVDADVLRGQRLLRRRRAVVGGTTAAALAAVLALSPVTAGGTKAQNDFDHLQPGPTSTPTDSPSKVGTDPLERIRAEGRVEDEQVMAPGFRVRTYVLCDGSPECSPDTDGPIRREHQQFAIEVTQVGRSALFRIGNSAMTVVTAYDDTTLLVTDPLSSTGDFFDPGQNSHRLVRADGTETSLRFEPDPAPAIPGPGVVLIKHYEINPDNDSVASQVVLVVEEDEGTVRLLDMPLIDMRRTWGPNLDERLWFVTFSCDLHFWSPSGTFETRDPGCSKSFDPGQYTTDATGGISDPYGNPGNGDITWVDGAWFPDGWLKPGRMAFLERDFLGRDDSRLTLHVTLNGAVTWKRVPVSDEAAIPGALNRLG